MRILKFGGSSVAGVDRLRSVAGIVKQAAQEDGAVLVVSALRGVTDTLLALADGAGRGQEPAGGAAALADRHRGILAALAGGAQERSLAGVLEEHLVGLQTRLAGIIAAGECCGEDRDAVAAVGERLAVVPAAAALGEAGVGWEMVDAAELIETDSSFGNARVDADATDLRSRARLGRVAPGRVAVVPGFVAADQGGRTTTLGRGGSDYSAAVLGAALHATAVEIWTDVAGVLTAPPRWVPWAGTLPRLSYDQARAISRWGGTVLHERTVDPVAPAGIPLHVASSLDPSGPRTVIGASPFQGSAPAVTARSGLVVLGVPAEGSAGADALRRGGVPCWYAGERLGLPQVLVGAEDAAQAEGVLAAAGARVAWRRDGVGAVVLVGADANSALAALRAAVGKLKLPVLAEVPAIEGTAAGVVVREHLLRRAVLEVHQAVVPAGFRGPGYRDRSRVAAAGAAAGRPS